MGSGGHPSVGSGGTPGLNCGVVACAPVAPKDGICKESAPSACCGWTDADCPSSPIMCELCAPQTADGVCSHTMDVCCPDADPDCSPLYNCNLSKIACQTFAAVKCLPGTVPTEANLCYGPCVPRNQCLPGTAPLDCSLVDCAPSAGPSPADGFCADPNPSLDCCGFSDQDCANVVKCRNVACTAISEISDGVCQRAFDDCCRTQDPDCSSVGGLIPPQRVCTVACVIPPRDGVCVRNPDSCCGRSDPDCVN